MYGGPLAYRCVHAVTDRPVVITFAGDDLLGTPYPSLIGPFRSWLAIRCSEVAARKAAGVVAMSKNLADRLPADLDGKPMHIIPNGIDTSRFHPLDRWECRRRLGWRHEGFHVLFASSTSVEDIHRKRPDLARQTVEVLRNTRPDVELHLMSGVPHADVPVWMNAADSLLVTSIHEGSQNIIKEALACNLPIVSVLAGDVQERIGGVEGCFLAPAEPAALASRLEAVYNGPRRIKGVEAVEDLTIERIAERLRDFYGEVLAHWSRRAAARN